MISEKTIYSLEFNKIREILKDFAVSQSGKKSILSMMPAEGLSAVNNLLDEVYQADKILYEYAESPDFSFDDIKEIIDKADKNITLTMSELLKVARVMKISRLAAESIGKINSTEIELIKDYANMLFADILKTTFINQFWAKMRWQIMHRLSLKGLGMRLQSLI